MSSKPGSPARRRKPTTDIVVAEWQKNAKEAVRVMLQVYRGKLDISIRVWYRDRDDQLKAGRQGINLRIKHMPKLRKALNKARKLAKTFVASTSSPKGGR